MRKSLTDYKRRMASDLRNRSGEVMDEVLRGEHVLLVRHGRAIAIVRPLTDEELMEYRTELREQVA